MSTNPSPYAGTQAPTGTAGGALSGTYPNPQLGTQTQALNMGGFGLSNVGSQAVTLPYMAGLFGNGSDTALVFDGQTTPIGAATLLSTTVASGSNNGLIQNIATWSSPSNGVLAVASTTSFPTAGNLVVACATNSPAVIAYTGTSGGNTFTGCTYVSGGTGAVTTGGVVGGPYTMTRDLQATSVTVNAGVTVKTAGFRTFCKGTVTIAATGVISADGNAASGSTAGGASNGSGVFQGSVAGGAGGTGASGTGGTGGGGNWGAAGGGGGAGTSGAAGNAGTIGATTVANYTSDVFTNPVPFLQGGAFWGSSGSNKGLTFGTGGGGGGSDAGSNAGGGGGASGGCVCIFAWAVVNNGTLSAQGGNGGNAAGGNAGGGGGGGGGLVIAFTLAAWTAGTITVNGGTHGTKLGTGSNGNDGGNGGSINVVLA